MVKALIVAIVACLPAGGWAGLVRPLDASSFANALESFDGLTVVKFYAPWCRTCRRVAEPFKTAVRNIENAGYPEGALQFCEVDFSKNKQLCLRERVFMLPTVHFYTSSLGRVNSFTLHARGLASLEDEIDRYVGETGHLSLLQTLRSTALSPMVRYVELIEVMEALRERSRLTSEVPKNEAIVSVVADSEERQEALQSLFDLIDTNHDGPQSKLMDGRPTLTLNS